MTMPKKLVWCASSAIRRLWIFIHTTLVANITQKDLQQSLIAEMRAVPHSFLWWNTEITMRRKGANTSKVEYLLLLVYINGYFRLTVPDFSVICNVVSGHCDHSGGRRQLVGDFLWLIVKHVFVHCIFNMYCIYSDQGTDHCIYFLSTTIAFIHEKEGHY